MTTVSRNLSWVFVGVGGFVVAMYLLMAAIPRQEGPKELHLRAFGQLPVLDHGRVKPIDSLARVSLTIISGKSEYTDDKGKVQPAVRWLLDVMTAKHRNQPEQGQLLTGPSAKIKAYRIEDDALRAKLQLEGSSRSLYSVEDLIAAAGPQEVLSLANDGLKVAQNRRLYRTDNPEVQLALQLHWHRYISLLESPQKIFRIDNEQVLALLGLEARQGFRYAIGEFAPRMSLLLQEKDRARAKHKTERSTYDVRVLEVGDHVDLYTGLATGLPFASTDSLHLIPPTEPGGEWQTYDEAMAALDQARGAPPGTVPEVENARSFRTLLLAYTQGDTERFNQTVKSYAKDVARVLPAAARKSATEAGFNDFAPFYRCIVLYFLVLIVAALSWMWRDPVITWFGLGLLVLTVLLHTWALGMRMYIQERPPVTNLYSSAVFIGWACVLVCVAIELWYRNGLAMSVAAKTGFATLIIAHYLSVSGDTLQMMQAVLDTNFWLATHVTTVTIGYSATFLAGFFGILFLWMMLVTATLSSLRTGGAQTMGQRLLFLLAAFTVSLFAVLLMIGVLYGLWYGADRDPSIGLLVRGLSVVLLLAGIAYAVYLFIQRAKLESATRAPDKLPEATSFLERFALTDTTRRVLVGMIYGTLCFATLFSFVGTVLGGIWADYSWGRFWGWDPKENGALLIVIMNALILHARWAGLVRDRGMAVLALGGNMVTMWSWFGTNQLGIGLHAYGFNNALVLLCRWFWVSQLALIGLALLPWKHWRDYQPVPLVEASVTEKAPSPRAKGKRGSSRVQPA